MANDIDVFTKLSRVLETSTFRDDSALNGQDTVFNKQMFTPSAGYESLRASNVQNTTANTGHGSTSNKLRTPYDTWKSKHKDLESAKEVIKLSGAQWDKLVDKMHQNNRQKQNTIAAKQNDGLAAELGGYQFKPRINKASQDLAKSMRKIQVRLPEMLAEKNANLEKQRKKKEEEEIKECTFSPARLGAKKSDYYLKKIGREKSTPEDFFQYHDEKLRRNELRKSIHDELISKELTFHPRIDPGSIKLQEKLMKNNMLSIDPVTRTAVVIPSEKQRKLNLEADNQYNGPTLVLESEHPYKNNINEYTNVAVPGAISYSITFDEATKTESIYDYIKIFHDDTHTVFWGCGKYCGGHDNSTSNWPGVNGRPPLVVPVNKFVVYFHTNNSVNDWGFRMYIVPTLSVNPENSKVSTSYSPTISPRAKSKVTSPGGSNVYERLYKKGIEKQAEVFSRYADAVHAKCNITLKPWEEAGKSKDGSNPAKSEVVVNRTKGAEAALEKLSESFIFSEHEVAHSKGNPFTVVEYTDDYELAYRQVRQCAAMQEENIAVENYQTMLDNDNELF